MCLAVPMRVISIDGDFAQVETGRLRRRINKQMVAGVKIGDYVVVHAGFAIEKVNPQKAQETLRLIHEIR